MKSIIEILKTEGRKATYKCQCGTVKTCWLIYIEQGRIKSCGCLRYKEISIRNTKHSGTGTRIYRIWRGIIGRCYFESATSFSDYGGRGIGVCDEWRHDFENFRDWSLSSGYNESLTIERVDNNGNYSPKNCKWISKSDQSKNKRERKTMPKRNKNGQFIKEFI